MPNLDEIKMSGTNLPVSFFIKAQLPENREIVTAAVYECLKKGWPVNRTAIGHLAREMRKNVSANAVTDVDANGDNVLLDSNNNLLFIDPIIKIKQPIDKIISAYPFVEMAPQSNMGSLTSFLKRIFNH